MGFCPENIDSQSVIYSMGIGEDVSWDEALIARKNVTIHGFDPTPRAIEYAKNRKLENFIVHPIGVSSKNGYMDFFTPINPSHVSHSLIKKNNTKYSIKVKIKSIDSIMDELNHKKIDILKMDIEGSEYEVIPDMLEKKIFPHQLLIEFHHRFDSFTIKNTTDIIDELIYYSYKISYISKNKQEFAFIRTTE
ncbi:FkbM family methyltransferase [Methanohalophilus mahii]|uniref:Methyltransferase FkbM family n=1 Tax=Methanohalophilus mahii (strain ATCC 35705 / DSM 5219 / SLP) TaxID=547558 RepID=D5E8W3_METMS|nr:FkbM family methyltransferase [Methanohalophilus mahii]ADE35622.1 methyltransferase FkbM family [Methanohalophilus mahii DSM 5219]